MAITVEELNEAIADYQNEWIARGYEFDPRTSTGELVVEVGTRLHMELTRAGESTHGVAVNLNDYHHMRMKVRVNDEVETYRIVHDYLPE